MCSGELLIMGFAGLFFGLPMALWPYKVARWSEIVDAIGRKPSGRVEPADWKVTLTYIIGAVMAIVGGIFFLLCMLS